MKGQATRNKIMLRLLGQGSLAGEFYKVHHGSSTVLRHSVKVVRMSLRIAERFNIKVDKQDLIQGALLHDYYIFDWRDNRCSLITHMLIHAKVAAHNAKRDYHVNKKVYNIIMSHMFPLNITVIPMSKEAWIVCIADKIVALQEQINFIKGV